MRRRQRPGSTTPTETVAAIGARVKADAAGLPARERVRFVRAALAEHDLNPLQVFRARYWLRKGRTDEDWR